jgi:hypothetical protein
MATIHTARNIVGNDKTTPLFSLKGLSNLVPSSITALTIQGIPLEKQVAYTQYSANIASFISAQALNKTITVSPAPLGRLLSKSALLPITPPVVSFTLQKVLNSDQTEKFIKILGPGASKTRSGKTTIFHAPSLPIDTLSSVGKLATPFFNAGRDAINPKGYIAYIFLSNIISLTSKVHSYPAFHTEDKESLTSFEQLLDGPIGGKYFAKDYKTTVDGKEVAKVRDLSDKSYSLNEFNKRGRSEDDMVDESESPMVKIAAQSSGYFSFQGNETVFKARPTKHAAVNIGSSSEIPRSTGLILPYFPGLIQPDAVFMNTMILRRFYQLLGDSHEACQNTYLDVRHGVNSLATTDRGMEICHMLLGIDLALDTQSRCFIIIDKGKYLGFSLIGARFAVFCNTKWYAPASEVELAKAINRMDPHESAIDDMIKRFEILQTKNQLDHTVERSTFDEPKRLAEVFEGLRISELDDDDVRELDRCIRNLNYMGTGYLTKNPQMIAEMLETIASNKSIELERPTFLPSIRAPFSSRIFAALSKFGPDAPSFWNDRGKEIICKPLENSVATTGGKRKIGKADDFGNMPDKILITPKPLTIAVQDMVKVIEKGKVKMDTDERAARYRNISVDHEETRKLLWKGLIAVCSESGKKQKPDAVEESEEGIDLDQLLHNLIG